MCFEFGIELEDITSSYEVTGKTTGKDRKIYRIDIPANRYDMLCVEGIARAIKTFLGLGKPPKYQLSTPSIMQQLIVDPLV